MSSYCSESVLLPLQHCACANQQDPASRLHFSLPNTRCSNSPGSVSKTNAECAFWSAHKDRALSSLNSVPWNSQTKDVATKPELKMKLNMLNNVLQGQVWLQDKTRWSIYIHSPWVKWTTCLLVRLHILFRACPNCHAEHRDLPTELSQQHSQRSQAFTSQPQTPCLEPLWLCAQGTIRSDLRLPDRVLRCFSWFLVISHFPPGDGLRWT